MIPQNYLLEYKDEWKKRGFRKNYLCWFKTLDEVTQVFKIENLRSNDCYVPYVGVALNRKLKNKCPTKYDKAWIVYFRMNLYRYDPEHRIALQQQKESFETLSLKLQEQYDTPSPYHLKPEIVIKAATNYFDKLDTIENVIDFIENSEEFANIDSNVFIKRIYEE